MQKNEIAALISELTDLELVVLSILSIYPDISRSGIFDRINQLGFRINSRGVYPKDFEPTLEKFLKNKIIVRNPNTSRYLVDEEFRTDILWNLKNSKIIDLFKAYFLKRSTIYYYRDTNEEIYAKIIISILSDDSSQFFELYKLYGSQVDLILIDLFDKPFRAERIDELNEKIKISILNILVFETIEETRNLNSCIEYFEQSNIEDKDHILNVLYIHKGDLEKIKNSGFGQILALYNLLQGRYELALQGFEKYLADYRKTIGKKNAFYFDISTPFYLIALLKQNNEKSNSIFDAALKEALKHKKGETSVYYLLDVVRHFRLNNIALAKQLLTNFKNMLNLSWDKYLVWALIKHWFDKFDKDELFSLQSKLRQAILNE